MKWKKFPVALLCGLNYRRLSTRLGILLILCLFWVLYVFVVQLNMLNTADMATAANDGRYFRDKVVEISKEYGQLAKNNDKLLIVDSDDGKKTAFLMQDMLRRLEMLEKRLSTMISQNSQEKASLREEIKQLMVSVKQESHAVHQSDCDIPSDPSYPECAGKVEWMKRFWKRERKYSENGVDGTICSFLVYLSEKEKFCPRRKCDMPDNKNFPECKQRVQWLQEHWKIDKKYSDNGVDGSLCSILSYLSTVETMCPLLPHAESVTFANDCKVPDDKDYPQCKNKVEWMKTHWKADPCYTKDYNVNGTICSFLEYLSTAESWCRRLSGVVATTPVSHHQTVDIKRTSRQLLSQILSRPVSASRLNWLKQRIDRMYNQWVDAVDSLNARLNISHNEQKKILIHIGILAEEKTFHFAEGAGKGGPLGELVQWSDLIASLYILGHDVHVTVEHPELVSSLGLPRGGQYCPPKGKLKFDLIFIDYLGLQFLKKKARSIIDFYSCRLRIVDSFGTEAQFNHNGPQPRFAAPPGVTTVPRIAMRGGNNLNLKQYMTMFPHSPDNSFLGFVVGSGKDLPTSLVKKPQAVAYGKHFSMWQDLKSRQFLDVIHEHFEIHATTGGQELTKVKSYLPSYVINHGVLAHEKLQNLLQESKLFIGIGFPYEGPAPLEAIAQGCVFFNPKFVPPKNQINTKFFKNKPTFRSLTSQLPYAEVFIGEPYVYTVNVKDMQSVRAALKKIVEKEPAPYLPFEYTHEGMLERVNAFINHQDFCQQNRNWPPLASRKVYVGKGGQSCQDVCLDKGLICEPSFFPSINNVHFLKKSAFLCDTDKVNNRPSLVAPAYVGEDKACVLQASPILYSCTGSHSSVQRLCPCRDYRLGQVALCRTCY